MKVYIPTLAHIPRMTLHDGVEYVTHTKDMADRLAEHTDARIHVSGVEERGLPGIAAQRNWILDNLVGHNSWVGMMDDDVLRITEYDGESEPIYENFSKPTRRPLADVAQELADKCESEGALVGSACGHDNVFWRQTQWGLCSLVQGRFIVVKNTGKRFWHKGYSDIEFCFYSIAMTGRSIVNRWIHAPSYQINREGGIGIDRPLEPLHELEEVYENLMFVDTNKHGHLLARLLVNSITKYPKWERENGKKVRRLMKEHGLCNTSI